MHRSWLGSLNALACFLLVACQPPPRMGEPDEVTAQQLQRERELYPGIESKTGSVDPLGRLEVFTTGVMTDGRNVNIRGKLRNPMSEPVTGVRLIFKIYGGGVGTTEPPCDSFQEEKAIQIPSGGTTALRMDVETMYAGSSGGGSFRIEAYAKRVGDRDIAPPPGWKE